MRLCWMVYIMDKWHMVIIYLITSSEPGTRD